MKNSHVELEPAKSFGSLGSPLIYSNPRLVPYKIEYDE